MKYSLAFTLALCIPLFVFPGCLEEHVRTTISADGSSERSISLKLPAKELPEKAFPVPADSTWSVEWKETGDKDSTLKYEYTARKIFSTPEELRREYAALPDTGGMSIGVSVDKRFQWFFTYLDYTETYIYHNPFTNVPVTDYLTRSEIEQFQHGEQNDELKHKVDRWSSRNEFEEIYRPLVAEAQRRQNPQLSASLLIAKKDECFNTIIAVDSANKVDSLKTPLKTARDVLTLLTKVVGTDELLSFEQVVEQELAAVEEKEHKMKHPDGWTYTTQMPGLILETNSNALEGNTITWKFTPDQIKVGDYTMHAVSRVANTWAFIVTGAAVLLVLLLAVRASFRRR